MMEPLKYKVIKTIAQYHRYAGLLEKLVMLNKKSTAERDVMELLQVLIEKYDRDHNTFTEADPIESLRFLMKDHKMKSVDLATALGVSTSLVSDILHRRRGLSKENIRKLAEQFSVSQELFNRPYALAAPAKDSAR
ncbi:helix-turn-helix domain-containing protein [Chitinophaga lutea]|nr:helix-turn-helix domain-containing protein [Chitinophaga lutea]